ncbi:MAG: SpoIIE family protein phosphatase [Spirochaetales bacterium]|nr:SpoIIE family protein phosphatase [Spirochaetales bacterium]
MRIPGRLRFLTFVSALFSIQLSSGLFARSYPVRMVDLDSPVSLDSAAEKGADAPVWWASASKIDPAAYSTVVLAQNPLRDEAGPDWAPVPTPSNLFESKALPLPESGDVKSSSYWLRLVFRATGHSRDAMAIRLGEISDRDRAYLNGVRIGETGVWGAELPQAYDKHRIYNIPEGLLRRDGLNVLLVELQPYFDYELGICKNYTEIGPAAVMWQTHYNKNWFDVLFLIAYLTVGMYFLFLFVRRRSQRENLFFGLFCIFLVLYQFLRTQIKYELGMDFHLLKRMEYISLFMMFIMINLFIRNYFELPRNLFMRWFDRVLYGLGALVFGTGIFIVALNPDTAVWSAYNNGYALKTQSFVFIPVMLGIVIYSMFKKNRDGFFIFAGMLFIIAAFVIDQLTHHGILNFMRVMGYAFAFFVMFLAVILANRFVRLHNEVEDLNKNLEKKVQDRTQQLADSLNEIRGLKEQQDGDYWLTSLLIKPLKGLFGRSPNVSIELLERQKKKFKFRKWSSEIGGDINAVHKITLRGREYTVVINGDAMGKSIQGAGGALVLGTVFKSVIARTEMSSHAANKYPEQWLKECFIEFQNVFTSFDGTMLMSAIIALVDDRSGLVYFINAEHPWAVLWRDGKAEFIEDRLHFRKFGTTGMEGSLEVKLFQMRPDDALILGSDGRDDIQTGVDERGLRIINESEQEFLRRVEDGHGNLIDIEESILAQGTLTDDFSMIRIGYKEDAPLAQETDYPEEYRMALQAGRKAFREGALEEAEKHLLAALGYRPDDQEALRDVGQISYRLKKYAEAVSFSGQYSDLSPGDSDVLYLISISAKQARQYMKAADFGERLRLRQPKHVKNLINLADVYRLLGNHARSEMLLGLALELDPENKNAAILQDVLQKA